MTSSARVALITGAARRLGAEMARTLHAAGFNIILHYHRSVDEAQALCAELNKQRAQSVVLYPANLLDISSLARLVETAAHEWGRLDVLINNASLFYKTHLGSVTDLEWDNLFTANLKAPFFLSQAAAPHLKKQQGCIINIGDVHGERPMGEYGVYCMTKAGISMLTQMLAKELGPDIRVNTIAPGTVLWPDGENTLNSALKEKIISRTALHRHGLPSDIAKAVLYLVTAADYMTGATLTVDGGRSLTI